MTRTLFAIVGPVQQRGSVARGDACARCASDRLRERTGRAEVAESLRSARPEWGAK